MSNSFYFLRYPAARAGGAYRSFGGWKQSMFGDLGTYGPDGTRFYTRRKTVTQRWPTSEVREGAVFSMPTLG